MSGTSTVYDITKYLNVASAMSATLTRGKSIRPHVNVHPFIDIPTGVAMHAVNGDIYINGGMAPFTGFGGVPNMFKSALADDFGMSALNNFFPFSEGTKFDTEDSASMERFISFRRRHDVLRLEGMEEYIRARMILTNTNRQEGGDQMGGWWKKHQTMAKETRDKKKRPKQYTTPFFEEVKQPDGTMKKIPYKCMMIIFSIIDSMSEMPVEKVDEMFEKNEAGHSDNNTEAMRGGAAKTQLIRQIPGFANEFKWYIIATAHLGKKVEMDLSKPPQEMLAYLQGLNFKHTPEKFAFLTNNCFVTLKSKPLLQERLVEYPYNPKDELTKNDTDLLRITACNTRGKNGPSGAQFFFIVSQSHGVDWDLTSWVYLRDKSNTGIEMKHGGMYHLHLLPDVSVSRKTVRKAIRENHKFRQALRATITIALAKNFWGNKYKEEYLSFEEIYNRLEARGVDWDLLYDTREYWTYAECEAEGFHKNPNNGLMLLEMAEDPNYSPSWYDKAVKDKAKAAEKAVALETKAKGKATT